MLIPLKYNLRYLCTRWKSTLLTAMTFSLVVATFVIVMSLAQGIKRALTTTGQPLNIIVMRSGAQAEGQSQISREQYGVLRTMPGLAMTPEGESLVAPEVITLVNTTRRDGKSATLQVRGVHPNAFAMRPAVRIIAGRMMNTGLREALVSRSVSTRFTGYQLGKSVRLGRGEFRIVGVFDAQGTAYDSEVWADYREIMQEFDRTEYSTVLMRAPTRDKVQGIIDQATGNRRLKLLAKDEETYYKEQTKTAQPVQAFAGFLAVTMAIGACFAGMNTMYGNVARRVREIGTLRILGFSRAAILVSFLVESVCLALLGGSMGCLLALPINGLATGTTNFNSFSEIVFCFSITPRLMVNGMIFAAVMGIVGGLLPAWSASRQPILAALRQM